MRCKKCNRELKDDESIERGYGPECWDSVEKRPVKYLYTGYFVPDDYEYDDPTIQEHMYSTVEDIGEEFEADIVLLRVTPISCVLDRELEHGMDDVLWFGKIDNNEHRPNIRARDEWKYADGVSPTKGVYSYAPFFVTCEGSMSIFNTGIVKTGKNKNLLEIERSMEARYTLPGVCTPHIYRDIPQVELTFKPMYCNLEYIQGLDESISDDIQERFATYLHDNFHEQDMTGVYDGFEEAKYTAIGDEEQSNYFQLLEACSLLNNEWGVQCQREISVISETHFDEYMITVANDDDWDNGYFLAFWDRLIDEMNDAMRDEAQEYDIWLHSDLHEYLESKRENEEY